MSFPPLIENRHLHHALILWAMFGAAVCVKTATRGGEHSVYPVFAAGARHWWDDKPLYADYEKTEGIDGYRYSPTFAVAFTPLALLPDRLGAMAWGLLSIALLAWSLHVLYATVFPDILKQWPNAEGTFLTLALVGSMVGIWSGQSNAILPALLALAIAAIVRGRWWTASILLAVPVFIKLWPMAFVLLLMACWPRKLIVRFAVVSAALALIPFLTRPPSTVAWQYQQWYVSLTGPLQGRWPGYRDAWTVWEQLCPPVHNRVYMGLQLVSALGVFGWCLWQQWRVEKSSNPHPSSLIPHPSASGHLLMLILSMWAAWQLLFGPGTEQLTYGIIAPSAGWAVLVSFAEKRARWLTLSAWAIMALLPSGDIEQAVIRVFPQGMILLPLGVVLFVVWLVWSSRLRFRKDPR